MLDIASVGNGLVGPGREVNQAAHGRLDPTSPSRPDHQMTPRASRASDRVEVSEHAGLMAQLNKVPDVRWDRIDAAKSAIQQDNYIDQHLDDAINKLLSDM